MNAIIEGLAFPEGTRWQINSLYFSDMHSHQVLRFDGKKLEVVAHIPGKPSGLGFLNENTLLVASQLDRSIYKVNLEKPLTTPTLFADVSGIATWLVNDMITNSKGDTYIGNFGSDAPPGQDIKPASLALVRADGSTEVAAEELYFPNGMVFSHDEKTLYVAETRSDPGRISAFDVNEDGTLSNRRVLYEFESELPDGLAIDKNEDIWVASPFTHEVIRLDLNGNVIERVAVESPYAVAIGGVSGNDLFVASADSWVPEESAIQRRGRIIEIKDAVR